MRRFLVVTSILLAAASAANAATLSVQLRDLTGGTAAGVHSIGIYIQCDAGTTANGFSGAQFDVLSSGTGLALFTGTTSTTGSNGPVLGYSKINPSAVDATSPGNEQVSAMLPQPVTSLNDGDADAVGFSIYNVPGGVDPSAGALGQTGGLEFVGKEAWNFSQTETLRVWLTGAQYFTDQSGDAAHRANYDAVTQLGTGGSNNGVLVTIVPEPATMVLMGLGGLGMIVAARRRAA